MEEEEKNKNKNLNENQITDHLILLLVIKLQWMDSISYQFKVIYDWISILSSSILSINKYF